MGSGFTSVSQTVNFNPSQPVTFSLNVPAGNNRILALSALDADGYVLSTLYVAVNVLANQENNAKISFFETVVGQVLANILSGTNPSALNNVNLADLRTYLINLTGFDQTNNKFTKINPFLVDTVSIANSISSNNGALPPANFTATTGVGTVNVKGQQSGLTIMITDLNSSFVQNATANSTAVQNVSPGMWKLTVMKTGLETITTDIKVIAGQTTDITIPALAPIVRVNSGDAATLAQIAANKAF